MIKVWGGEQEKDIILRLFNIDDGVLLAAVDETGAKISGSNLLYISKKGILRCFNVEKDIGLPVDSNGRVMFDGKEMQGLLTCSNLEGKTCNGSRCPLERSRIKCCKFCQEKETCKYVCTTYEGIIAAKKLDKNV